MTTATTTTTTDDATHVFETAGLGKAPFRFVGASEIRGPIRMAQADGTVLEVGSPGQPMGTCQYCGQGIAICCRIKSADGKTFIVGSDCVQKTGDAGLRSRTKKAVNKMAAEARKAREGKRIADAKRRLESDAILRGTLSSQPHPLKWRADQGDTRLDWAEWMMRCSGNAGSMKVVRHIDKIDK